LCATAIETLSIAAMCVYNTDLSSFESIAETQPQLHPASLRLSAQHTCHGNLNSTATATAAATPTATPDRDGDSDN